MAKSHCQCNVKSSWRSLKHSQTTLRQQFNLFNKSATSSKVNKQDSKQASSKRPKAPRLLLVHRFIFYVYNIIMSLTSRRYTLFSHCNFMGDRTLHWAYAKHIDTLHALLTNTYNIYPHSTQLILINIIISTELSQYTCPTMIIISRKYIKIYNS